MSFAKSLNPASVHVRVGVANASFDDAMRRGDLEEASNILNGPLRTYAAVFMTDSEVQAWDARPSFATGDKRTSHEVRRDMENRRIELLRHLRNTVGVMASKPEEWGDGSSLEEAIPDDNPV